MDGLSIDELRMALPSRKEQRTNRLYCCHEKAESENFLMPLPEKGNLAGRIVLTKLFK